MTENIYLSDIHPTEHHAFPQIPTNADGTTDQRQLDESSPQACMVCRRSVKVESWEDLQPGDHIETPMVCCCILPTYHHAIVNEIDTPQNDKTKIKVIDVARKYDGCSRNFKIDSHMLKFNGSNDLKCKFIQKVDYKCRGYSEMETFERAKRCLEKPYDRAEKYSLFLRNCEHFAVDMVSGECDRDDNSRRREYLCLGSCKSKSISLQSVRCFWIFMHILFSALHCGAFCLNFYLYAVYGHHNERYNHWFGNTATNKLRWCYTGSKIRGFRTRCDWLFLGMMVFLYLMFYGCLLRRQSKTIQKTCRKCKVSSRLIYLTKLLMIILMDIFNIFSESWLYIFIEWLDFTFAFTIFILIMVTLFELVLGLFIVPNLIVRYCFIRCYPKCRVRCPKPSSCIRSYMFSCFCCPWDFDEHSYKYFNQYG